MQTYRFGVFELDLETQQLSASGEPVRLERRPWELLVLLVTRHGRLVPREEIIDKLWPDNVIIDFDSGLNTLVRKVRNALGDSADDPQFIETVAGRGYRFIAPVAEPAAPVPAADEAGRPLSVRRQRPWRIAGSMAVLGALLLAAVVWRSGSDPSADTRIVVMPFENLTGVESLGYMASGLAEETSLSLARIDLPDLAVIGGVSARAMGNPATSLQQIGQELDADFIVLSSLRLDESRIRVTSRLIRVADSEQVWSASFDRELTNVLGLQRELSVAIAEQVRQRLSPDVLAAIDRRQTQNPEAYQLYLKGRYEWSRFSPVSVREALQYYRQAVAEDPDYALAWAGIAHALITSPMTADARPASILDASREALQNALAAGPDLSETQLALAAYRFFLDWDWPSAEAAARRSVALDPNSAMSHMQLGIILSYRGNHIEARAMLRRARELDPLFPLMFANSANVALVAGDAEASHELARQAIAISPEFWVGYFHLGKRFVAVGDYEGALAVYSDVQKLSGNNSKAASSTGWLLARLGREDEARAVLVEMLSRTSTEYVPPHAIAVIYAGLGEVDAAFEWLDRAFEARDVHLLGLQDDPMLDTLRADPRFAAYASLPGRDTLYALHAAPDAGN